MAIKYLQNLKALNKEKVKHEFGGNGNKLPDSEEHVTILHNRNMICFRLQRGSKKKIGKNGCEVDKLVEVALLLVNELNKSSPSKYNALALSYLTSALGALSQRRREVGGDVEYPDDNGNGGGEDPGNGGGNNGGGNGNDKPPKDKNN